MKAIPKVDLNGFYVEDCIVDADIEGVQEIYEPLFATFPIETEEEDQDEGELEEEEIPRVLIGYLIGFPIEQSFYRPKFDLDSWKKIEDDNYSKLWVEALTQAEIDELLKPPIIKPTEVEKKLAAVEEELSGTQMALVSTYEQLVKSEEEATSTQMALIEVYEHILVLESLVMEEK